MFKFSKVALFFFSLFILIGCTPPITIPEYRITVAGIDNIKAKTLEDAIEKRGYEVRREKEYNYDKFGKYELNTQTFVIRHPRLTFKNIQDLTSFILRGSLLDNVSLKSVSQYYLTTSGEGSVKIILYLKLPPNSKACYKKTRKEIPLKWDAKEKKSSFTYYQRHSKEEYIDIFFVPKNKSCKSYTPKTFQRIYLSYPYQTETRPWRGGFFNIPMPF